MSKNVDFSFIRYANGWEDTQLLIDNLNPQSGDKILSIAASGDNSLALLTQNPEIVVAFDINETQLFLTELKQMAIKVLEYPDVLELIGITHSTNRIKHFYSLKNNLSMACQAYFQNNIHLIENGLIYQGKFENYFRIFRSYILPIIHSKTTINQLFEAKTAEEQLDFYNKKWNTWLWKSLFKVFFSKLVLGKLGRDPQFFKENKLPVSQTIFNAAEKHLSSTQVFKNYYLDFQLRGTYTVALPYYLREENYLKIKENINHLTLKKGFLTDISNKEKFDLANLSNIFEYMNENLFQEQALFLEEIMANQSKIAYWNLLVSRDLNSLNKQFRTIETMGNDLCFFYKSFHLNQFQA